MAYLIYSAISSLDGYIEDQDGKFNWAAPDDEVHSFINDLQRTAGTYLYGRRMYETMKGWETDPDIAAASPLLQDFAEIWQSVEKIVYSKTLENASTSKTQIRRTFEENEILQLKRISDGEIYIGGPNLASHAFQARLIDECHLFLTPVIVGGGKPSLPNDLHLELELLEQRRFDSGIVFLRYRTRK